MCSLERLGKGLFVASKWLLIESRMLRYISNKGLKEGDPLPSDADLAKRFDCSLQPVVRAMQELARKGFVRRTKGMPTTICARPPLADESEFSFSRSATSTYGHHLETKIVRVGPGFPRQSSDGAGHEGRAHQVLGLKKNEPFLAIGRLRILDGRPRALHRVFLNPDHFPADFLVRHDFSKESLIEIYRLHGYTIDSRDTTLRARYPTREERQLIQIDEVPILEAEQKLFALCSTSDEPVLLEYMLACYVDWEYRVLNRRAPSS